MCTKVGHTVIRSAISGYPPPVREAQLKFVGRSSFCFSVKGIRFEPPEYVYTYIDDNGRYVKDRTLKDRLTTEQVPYTLKTGNDRIHT